MDDESQGLPMRDAVLSGLAVLGLAAGLGAQIAGQDGLAPWAYGVTYLAGGLPAGGQALRSLWRDRVLEIDLLMVVAALAAAAVGAMAEGAILLVLFSLSGTLEHLALGRARRAVDALIALRPRTALRLGPGGAVEVPVESLMPGDRVVIRPGARVPVDARLVEGRGPLDESAVTGESMPVTKGPGAPVFEATVNLSSVLTAVVTARAADSTVARMVALVTEAQAAKAPSERFSEWFGQRYTVGVLAGSTLAFGVFLALGRSMQDALYSAATLLVAASPCAVVISVPAAILSALAAAARGGVLFKGGAALERLGGVTQFAFDKTGTLTEGRPAVTGLVALDGDETRLLARLAGIEAQAEHHSAAALRACAAARAVAPVAVQSVTTRPGEGVTGWAEGDGPAPLWAGNARLAARMGAAVDDTRLVALAGTGASIVYLGRGAVTLGAAALADRPRPGAAAALAGLRRGGIARLLMLTGDRPEVAARIAADLGLAPDDVAGGLLPEEKLDRVARLRAAGPVAFVGDGVNDAAALARADVGIAMGAAGSEVAVQAADVALMSDDLARLAAAHRLARRTRAVIRQNLTFALGAMLVLVTATIFVDLPLPLAVIGHEGGTLLVVLNGLRLLFDPIRARPLPPSALPTPAQ
ncbi:MAG: heavy metal translocating P-type ATPase [Rhodobacterales bacterium]|nr:heavy metal translocating P-type ATPase [Rhodobacterales bacterium]